MKRPTSARWRPALPSIALVLVLWPLVARAGDAEDIRALRKEVEQLRETVRTLQSQVQRLQAGTSEAPPPAETAATEEEKQLEAELRAVMPAPASTPAAGTAVAAAPRPAPSGTGAAIGKSSTLLNPDISFNGDFTFLGTDNRQLDKANRFSFREAEIGFQAPIDPYARADAFITFGEGESPDVEEAYATFLTLPWNLQARVGKFRVSFGKNNLLHRHALPQTDRPLVETANFGDEGLSAPGVGVSYLVPNPWDRYLLLTGEVVNGLDDSLAGGQGTPLARPARARSFGDFAWVGHAQSFFDLNDDSNVELGGSLLVNQPRQGPDRRVYGVDLTYRWRPLRQSNYHQLLWRTEGYFTHLDAQAAGASTHDTAGLYSYAEYRLSQTLWIGNRVDWTEIPGTSGAKEWGVFPYFTFSPLEFGYFRVGYEFVRSDRLQHEDSNRIWLQYDFSIGPHAAHAF